MEGNFLNMTKRTYTKPTKSIVHNSKTENKSIKIKNNTKIPIISIIIFLIIMCQRSQSAHYDKENKQIRTGKGETVCHYLQIISFSMYKTQENQMNYQCSKVARQKSIYTILPFYFIHVFKKKTHLINVLLRPFKIAFTIATKI